MQDQDGQNNNINKLNYNCSLFRGKTCDVEKEMNDLESFSTRNNVVQLKGFKPTLRALTSPSALKPFAILVTYFAIYQFSGVNSVTFYAVQVFKVCCCGCYIQ